VTFRRILLGAALAAGLTSVAQAQCDTSFSLVNRSGMTINEFYFGSSAQSSWGIDQLGTSVLPNGASLRFSARHPGTNDFKVVWANGETAQLMRVNICTTNEIIATRRGLEAR
jgi:hypothetical protein